MIGCPLQGSQFVGHINTSTMDGAVLVQSSDIDV